MEVSGRKRTGSGWVAESNVPVRGVAERLVLGRAATAQRVVFGRGALPELYAHQVDAAGNRVRPVVGDGDHRRAASPPPLHDARLLVCRPRPTLLLPPPLLLPPAPCRPAPTL